MNLYCAPVEFAVQPDCRPPARYIPGGITVNPGGLQYNWPQHHSPTTYLPVDAASVHEQANIILTVSGEKVLDETARLSPDDVQDLSKTVL